MANTKSAKKRVKRNEKRRKLNRIHIGASRTSVKKARIALTSGDITEANTAVADAVRALDKAKSKGVIHANKAARQKSTLMKWLHNLNTEG